MRLIKMIVTPNCQSEPAGRQCRLSVRKAQYQIVFTGKPSDREGVKRGIVHPVAPLRSVGTPAMPDPTGWGIPLIPIDRSPLQIRASNPAVSSLGFSPTPAR